MGCYNFDVLGWSGSGDYVQWYKMNAGSNAGKIYLRYYDRDQSKWWYCINTWVQIDGKWYYLDDNGYRVTGKCSVPKTNAISGSGKVEDNDWYYFDDNYTLKDTDLFKAKANTEVTPNVRYYDGFTSPDTQTVKVKDDGTTVINYYYNRNYYYFDLNGYLDFKESPFISNYYKNKPSNATHNVNGNPMGSNHTYDTPLKLAKNGYT